MILGILGGLSLTFAGVCDSSERLSRLIDVSDMDETCIERGNRILSKVDWLKVKYVDASNAQHVIPHGGNRMETFESLINAMHSESTDSEQSPQTEPRSKT